MNNEEREVYLDLNDLKSNIISLINEEIKDKKNQKLRVCLQFPDGLKSISKEIVDDLEEKFNEVDFFIWLDSNFGACDVPLQLNKSVDILITVGHSQFIY